MPARASETVAPLRRFCSGAVVAPLGASANKTVSVNLTVLPTPDALFPFRSLRRPQFLTLVKQA